MAATGEKRTYRTREGLLNRQNITVEPDFDISCDGKYYILAVITASPEVSDRIIAGQCAGCEGRRLSLNAGYEPFSGKVWMECEICADARGTDPEYYPYNPTRQERREVSAAITEKLKAVCGRTPEEFVARAS